MPHSIAPAPAPLQQLAQQFQQWRDGHPPRSRLPEPLWAAAAALASQHGLFLTARTLRLDYPTLKKRLHAAPSTAPEAFLELLAPAASTSANCLIELENPRGAKLRIQTSLAPPALARLLHAWLETGA